MEHNNWERIITIAAALVALAAGVFIVGLLVAGCGPQAEQVCHPREINRCECNPDAGPQGQNSRGGYMVCDPTGFYWHDCVCTAHDAP